MFSTKNFTAISLLGTQSLGSRAKRCFREHVENSGIFQLSKFLICFFWFPFLCLRILIFLATHFCDVFAYPGLPGYSKLHLYSFFATKKALKARRRARHGSRSILTCLKMLLKSFLVIWSIELVLKTCQKQKKYNITKVRCQAWTFGGFLPHINR